MAREIPQVRYFKIQPAMAAEKLHGLIAAGGDAIEGPFDGEESITLMADLDAGATGTLCSALLPDLIGGVVRHFAGGDRTGTAGEQRRILPLINFENHQCGLRACKTVKMVGGVIASDKVRQTMALLSPATRAGLLELAAKTSPWRCDGASELRRREREAARRAASRSPASHRSVEAEHAMALA